jgi:lipoprotein-anchoring transpeptidase ErfK/SrfK
MKLLPSLALLAVVVTFSSCSTVGDIVTSQIPERHSGRPAVVVSLKEQRAYLLRNGRVTASSRISSGREGHRTPTGRFRVIGKKERHRSSLYGDYVDARTGRVVRANVDTRKHRRPRGTKYVGAPMPYYVQFLPSYGLHAGYLPGVPASHGCIRMPHWKARQFYRAVKIGTPVTVKP